MAPSLSVSKSTGLFFYEKNSLSPLWHKVSEKRPTSWRLKNPFDKHMSSWIISLSRGETKQYLKPPPIVESQKISREKLQT